MGRGEEEQKAGERWGDLWREEKVMKGEKKR